MIEEVAEVSAEIAVYLIDSLHSFETVALIRSLKCGTWKNGLARSNGD